MKGQRGAPPALAFVGIMVPDEPPFHGPAFSRAAQMFQRELVLALGRAGLAPDTIFSIEPIPSFPRSRRWFGRAGVLTTAEGLRLRFVPFLNVKPLKPITAGLALIATLIRWGWRARGRQRIVHCVNLSMPPSLSVLIGARLIGAKATVSILDIWKPGELVPDNVYRRIDFAVQRKLIPEFDGHAVVSKAIAEDFLPGRPTCLIEGGVRPEDYAGAPPARSDDLFRMVLAGALESHNGVGLALDALQFLPRDGIELVIAGTGSFEPLVRARAAADPRVRFQGFLSFQDMLALYRTADVLLNVRVTQTIRTTYFFPSKLMEFLASAVPVISTCAGHVEEEFGSFVYLLRDETPESLAALIRDVRARPPAERTAMGEQASTYVLQHKSWTRQGEKLVGYLQTHVLESA